jgi:hypothetical protein
MTGEINDPEQIDMLKRCSVAKNPAEWNSWRRENTSVRSAKVDDALLPTLEYLVRRNNWREWYKKTGLFGFLFKSSGGFQTMADQRSGLLLGSSLQRLSLQQSIIGLMFCNCT